MLDATVTSLTGAASSPPSDQQTLSADREIPAHSVDARVHAADGLHQQPVADLGQHLVRGSARPGRSCTARVPTPGALLYPARTALAVEPVPARRAEVLSYRKHRRYPPRSSGCAGKPGPRRRTRPPPRPPARSGRPRG